MALILIADDDALIVEIVQQALGARGHIVGGVDDGLPVMRVLKTKHPALLILDCAMPRTSGIEVLRLMRNSPDWFDLPVLMLTGRRSEQDEELAMRSGANDYLRKPFDPDELVVRAEALIAQHSRASLATGLPATAFDRRWHAR